VDLTAWLCTGSGDQLVSAIGGQPNLALVARQIGLDREFTVLNPEHVGEATDNTLATTVEAILGAIYWDSKNEQAVRRAMIQMGLFAKSYAVGREGRDFLSPRLDNQ
jgi:dsRNA-specific ribonuclease